MKKQRPKKSNHRVRVPAELWRRLAEKAAIDGRSVNNFALRCLEEKAGSIEVRT